MRKHLIAIASLSFVLAGSASAQQGQYGTAAEAKAMLERAVTALKADPKSALEKFRKRIDGFGDRDLYVFCNGTDGASVAHPNPAQAGSNLNTLKDAAGKAFGKEMLAKAREGQITEVDYVFPRLGDSKPVAKESYVTKVGTLICGVGFYK
jgi:signal transduction histidine kinase